MNSHRLFQTAGWMNRLTNEQTDRQNGPTKKNKIILLNQFNEYRQTEKQMILQIMSKYTDGQMDIHTD